MAYTPEPNSYEANTLVEKQRLIPKKPLSQKQRRFLSIFERDQLPRTYDYLKLGRHMFHKTAAITVSVWSAITASTILAEYALTHTHHHFQPSLLVVDAIFAILPIVGVTTSLDESITANSSSVSYDYGDLPHIEKLRLQILPSLTNTQVDSVNNLVLYARSITAPLVENTPATTAIPANSSARKAYDAKRKAYYQQVDDELAEIKTLLQTLDTAVSECKAIEADLPAPLPEPTTPTPTLAVPVYPINTDEAEQHLLSLATAHKRLSK